MRRALRQSLLLALVAAATVAPAAAAPPLVQQGKQLYGEYCVACHGAGGSGIQQRSHRIGGGPGRGQSEQVGIAPSLRGVGALATDFYLSTGYMPLPHIGLQPRRSHKILSPSQIDALVAYVASLGKGPRVPRPHPESGSLSRGMKLFTDHCAGCHQVVAAGGYLTDAVAPPLDQATATQIAEAVRIGPYVMPRFSPRQISEADLNSIIRYVQYAKHPDDRGGWALGHVGPVPEGLVTWFLAAAVLIAVCVVIGKRLKREAA